MRLVPVTLLFRIRLSSVSAPTSETETENVIIPVLEESLEVQKLQVITGTVRLRKVVHEHEAIVDEPLLTGTVQIERVPINRAVEGPVPVRQDGETTIISIIEEVLVVTKQLILKEELRITRHIAETHNPQRVTVRSEEVTVERIRTQDLEASQVGSS